MGILDTNYIDHNTLETKHFLRGNIIAENKKLFDAVDGELRRVAEENYHFIKDIRLDVNVNKNHNLLASDFQIVLDKFASVYGARKIKDFYYSMGITQLIYELIGEVVLIIPATQGAASNTGYSHNPGPPLFTRTTADGNSFQFYAPIYEYYVRFLSENMVDAGETGTVLDIGEMLDDEQGVRTLDFLGGINEQFILALNNAASNVYWVMKVVRPSTRPATSRDVDAFLFELFANKRQRHDLLRVLCSVLLLS